MDVKSETIGRPKNGGSEPGPEPRENLLGLSAPELKKLFHAFGGSPTGDGRSRNGSMAGAFPIFRP